MKEKTPKKNVEKETTKYQQQEKHYVRIYNTVQWIILTLTIVLWSINWRLGIVSIAWLLWNFAAYETGCQEQVVDEYEHDGYPKDGLRRMFHSWKIFAVLGGLSLYVLFQM